MLSVDFTNDLNQIGKMKRVRNILYKGYNRMKKIVLCLSLLITSFYSVAQDLTKVEVSSQKAAGDVYMLTGAGGNIGVLATDQGLLLVDDQFQPLAEKIEAAMKSIKNNQLKYIVNTHYHGDHIGSNAHFSQYAPIVAHENVRNRLMKKENTKLAHYLLLPIKTV